MKLPVIKDDYSIEYTCTVIHGYGNEHSRRIVIFKGGRQVATCPLSIDTGGSADISVLKPDDLSLGIIKIVDSRNEHVVDVQNGDVYLVENHLGTPYAGKLTSEREGPSAILDDERGVVEMAMVGDETAHPVKDLWGKVTWVKVADISWQGRTATVTHHQHSIPLQ